MLGTITRTGGVGVATVIRIIAATNEREPPTPLILTCSCTKLGAHYWRPAMRVKHRKDYNNGKNGWVGGNPRYAGKGFKKGDRPKANAARPTQHGAKHCAPNTINGHGCP